MSLECAYPNGRLTQSTTEEIPYIIDCAAWDTTPTSPVVDSVIDETSGTDVKATVMPSGTPSVTGSKIILPLLKSLTLGRNYRPEVRYTGSNSSRKEFHLRVRAV